MSLLNTKFMERHRKMFKEQRFSQKCQNVSQKAYFSQSSSQLILWTGTQNSVSTSSYRPTPYSEAKKERNNCFEDVVVIGRYVFVYDKEFLNKLRQLTKELRTSFSTIESRSKSRNVVQNLEQNIEESKKALLQRIDDNIAAIVRASDIIQESNTQQMDSEGTHGLNSSQITQQLSSIHIKPENCVFQSTHDSDSDLEDNSELEDRSQIMYSSEYPLHTQQYIQSLDSSHISTKRFRFSDENYRIVSPSQLSSSYDSGVNVKTPDSQEYFASEELIDSQMSSYEKANQSTDSNKKELQIVNRHKWTNTDYDLSTGITLKPVPQNKVRTQRKRRRQLKFVLKKIKELIDEDVFCTKRDLYYQNVALFNGSQRVVDEIVDDLACSLRVSRTKLHIVSSTRGLVFGHLKFANTNGILTDCLSSPNGINIPNDTERIARMESKALFLLIIEKDATFQQLIDLRIDLKYPLIMVTGHGYPDLNTRAFVHMIWNTFEIPIFGLVDGDAHGLEILCTFRHGSLALSYESHNLVAPVIRWLGILPTDIIDYELSSSVQISLSERDRKKINDLKKRIYMSGNHEWTKQLDILLRIGKKVEIQSLAEHWPTFLLDVYLPAKIRYGKWI